MGRSVEARPPQELEEAQNTDSIETTASFGHRNNRTSTLVYCPLRAEPNGVRIFCAIPWNFGHM
jgi:hypothetical protein